MPDVDFEFDAGAPLDSETDLIEHRPDRWPVRWLTAAALIVAVAAAVVTLRSPHDHPAARPSPSSGSSPAVTGAAPVPAALVGLAHVVTVAQTGALHDDVESDREVICPSVAAERQTQTVMNVVTAQLPGFALVDAAATRGARGTVCGLEVRARDALGSTVVVTVLAPPDADSTPFQISRGNDRSTVLVVCAIEGSWSVQVGWSARTGRQVTYSTLAAIADDARVRW